MRVLTVAAVLLCAGCASKQPIYLELPLNRFDSPERSAAQVDFAFSLTGVNSLVLTEDQQTTPPDPQRARLANCPRTEESDPFVPEVCSPLSLRLGLQAGQPLQFAVSAGNGLVTGKAKFFLFDTDPGDAPAGAGSMALTLAYGASDIEHEGGSASTDLQRRMRDAALILGYRLGKRVLLYGGGFYSRHNFDGEHQRSVEQSEEPGGGLLDDLLGTGGEPGSSSGIVTTPLAGRVTLRGINLGLRTQFDARGRRAVLVECAWAEFDSDGQDGDRARCGLGMEFAFGAAVSE